jgi:hypothetical protein
MNNELLQITLLGGFAGFAIFCASYAFVVWKRRNKNDAVRRHLLTAARNTLGLSGAACLLYGIAQAGLGTHTGLIDSDTFDRTHLEARARLGALSSAPLKIDPALIQRQNQLRTEIDQTTLFKFDLEKQRREFERDYAKLKSDLAGYPQRVAVADRQLGRATELVRLGQWSEAVSDQRRMEALALKDEAARAKASAQLYEFQIADINIRAAEFTDTLNQLHFKLSVVEGLIAEDGEKVLKASSGAGFVVKAVVPASEIDALKNAKTVTFRPSNTSIHSRFSGIVREIKETSFGEASVNFDVRLPPDVLAQIKNSSEPVLVDIYWSPMLLQSASVQVGLGLVAITMLIWFVGTLRRRQSTPHVVVAFKKRAS